MTAFYARRHFYKDKEFFDLFEQIIEVTPSKQLPAYD